MSFQPPKLDLNPVDFERFSKRLTTEITTLVPSLRSKGFDGLNTPSEYVARRVGFITVSGAITKVDDVIFNYRAVSGRQVFMRVLTWA